MVSKRIINCEHYAVINQHSDLLKLLLPPVSYDVQAPNLAAELNAEGTAMDAAYQNAQIILQALVPNAGPLLEDWERVYGTPSPCSQAIGLTRNQRVDLVKAKINAGGTMTKQKVIDIAALIGYSITIFEYTDRSMGDNLGGDFGNTDWGFTWDVITQNNTIYSRSMGDDLGGYFRTWGNDLLECILKPITPAGTILRFIYN